VDMDEGVTNGQQLRLEPLSNHGRAPQRWTGTWTSALKGQDLSSRFWLQLLLPLEEQTVQPGATRAVITPPIGVQLR